MHRPVPHPWGTYNPTCLSWYLSYYQGRRPEPLTIVGHIRKCTCICNLTYTSTLLQYLQSPLLSENDR